MIQESNEIDSINIVILEKKYKIEKFIGKGKFGMIYQGIHLKTNKKIAIKIENGNSSVKILKYETTILKYLYDNGCRSIPTIFCFGLYNNSHYLVMSFYKCSLYEYRKQNVMDEKHIHSIMFKMIEILQQIHQQFIIHRDIKPHNFMITPENDIHLIDFGLANVENPNLILTNESKELIVGTPNYISYNIHCGYDPLRRDDLISIGYVSLFLFLGFIPWEQDEIEPLTNEYPNIHILSNHLQKKKMKKTLENVIIHCSPTMKKYFTYCYDLNSQKNPHYDGLKQLFSC